jgi:hypothetical protein
MALLQTQLKPLLFGKLIILIMEKIIHKGKNYGSVAKNQNILQNR